MRSIQLRSAVLFLAASVAAGLCQGPPGKGPADLKEALEREQDPARVKAAAESLATALWGVSGGKLEAALAEADKVRLAGRRYLVSAALARLAPDKYAEYRRPRQFLAALLAAIPFAALWFVRRVRRLATMGVAAMLGWGAWTMICHGARELPPMPLPFVTASFLAFLSAGIAASFVGWLPWDRIPPGLMRGLGRMGIAGAIAGVLAGGACTVTRYQGVYPDSGSGLDLLLESVGCLHLGILAGVLLGAIDLIIERRKQRLEGIEQEMSID